MAGLDLYHAKRDFSRTREPRGRTKRGGAAGGHYVIHKHAARRLHYDLRLEHDGVLWSWAVTRGPSLDPGEKRLAVHVEDHPLDYRSFEGNIPKGEYGGGAVIVWDQGSWKPEGDPAAGMRKGHLRFTIEGRKLGGAWDLVRLRGRRGEKRDNWLLIKVDDDAARRQGDVLEDEPGSALSGRTIEQVAAETDPEPAPVPAPERSAAKGKAKPEDEAPLPDFVPPALAVLAERPPEGDSWLHEVKLDGYRVMVRIADGEVRLSSRTGLAWSKRLGRPLVEALAALPCRRALLDGEIVVPDDAGVSSFAALQAALSDGAHERLVLYLFDLLLLDGTDCREQPLLTRKAALEDLLKDVPADGPLRFSDHFTEPGGLMLEHSCRLGLEGVVSKRADAPYRSGRSQDWIKSKCALRQEFVITGWLPQKGSGKGLGSLVVGYRRDGKLVPAGRVGTGFSREIAKDLEERLAPLKSERSAYDGKAGRERGVTWVRPELVAEVAFRSWTANGLIRQASYQGLREDKEADEVVAERPAAKTEGKGGPKARNAATPAATPGTAVRLSHPEKLLWPDAGLTKQGLLDYHAAVWPRMAPHLLGRPLSLLRAPDGVGGQTFFQKHAGPGLHQAIERRRDPGGKDELLLIRDFDGVAALVQLGVVEIHVWGSTFERIEQPDRIVFDLDPDEGVEVAAVRAAALEIRDRLAELDLPSFVKLSGGKGYHITVPLRPEADWEMVKGFARDFARALAEAAPERYTATLSKRARKGRILIDHLRNGRGATAVVPYGTRARAGATVALPVGWQEVEDGLGPADIRVEQAMRRVLGNEPDPWADFEQAAVPLRLGGGKA